MGIMVVCEGRGLVFRPENVATEIFGVKQAGIPLDGSALQFDPKIEDKTIR